MNVQECIDNLKNDTDTDNTLKALRKVNLMTEDFANAKTAKSNKYTINRTNTNEKPKRIYSRS